MVTRELTKGITRDITRGIIQPFNYFIFTVKTDNAGTSLTDQFTVPTVSGGTYDAYVDWGDGSAIENITTYNDAGWTHTFTGGAGTYEVKIWGLFVGWAFDDSGDEEKYLKTKQVGIFKTLGDKGAFFGCVNHVWEATDAGNLANIISLFQYFRENTSLVTIPALDKMWTAATTTVATGFFNSAFNDPIISRVNTSGTVSFQNSFWGAFNFNQDISNFNFEAITTTAGLTNFLRDTPFDDDNYELLLLSMITQTILAGQTPHFGTAKWKFGYGGQARFDMLSDGTFTSATDGGQKDATMGVWLNPHNTLKTSANPSDGTSVTSWKDLSDNNNNADEATNPPVFKTNIANGEPMMLFDGADTTAAIASDASINNLFQGGGSFTCAILPLSDGEGNLGRIFSQSGGNCYLDLGDESGGACKIRLVMTFSGSNGAWKTSNLDINIGELNIIHVEYNLDDPANDPVFYINNSTTPVSLNEDSTPTGTASAANTITIGNAAITNRTFDGYMGDLGFFKSIPSSATRQERMNYLATKYGVTLS